MGPASLDFVTATPAGDLLLGIAAGQGSAAHPYARSDSLLRGPEASRNLADFANFLCIVHGRNPGAADHAAIRVTEPEPRAWLARATDAFAAERAFLVRLAAAAGPIPATQGAADSEIVVNGQRHAIESLAQSERRGCALGAVLALAADWAEVRTVLETAADRFGIAFTPYSLGGREEIRRVADAYAASGPVQRALLFGAEQISLQHLGLWDLLEARQTARAGIA